MDLPPELWDVVSRRHPGSYQTLRQVSTAAREAGNERLAEELALLLKKMEMARPHLNFGPFLVEVGKQTGSGMRVHNYPPQFWLLEGNIDLEISELEQLTLLPLLREKLELAPRDRIEIRPGSFASISVELNEYHPGAITIYHVLLAAEYPTQLEALEAILDFLHDHDIFLWSQDAVEELRGDAHFEQNLDQVQGLLRAREGI